MPNWCSNYLEITAESKDKIDEVLEAIRSDEEPLSLEVIAPTPAELLGRGRDCKPSGLPLEEVLEASHKRLMDVCNGRAKDYQDWYEFRLGEWGTKWELEGVYLEEVMDNAVRLEFTSAWSPPDKIVDKLMDKYPEVHFALYFYEPGCVFAGVYGTDGDTCYGSGEVEKIKSFATKHFRGELSDWDDH